MEGEQPDSLTAGRALRVIRELATRSENILIVEHGQQRSRQRNISPLQIQQCCLKGTITEGPFLNSHGNWQVSLFRHAAGQKVTCVVAIDWPSRLIVVTVYSGR
jgi:hypothetical protein